MRCFVLMTVALLSVATVRDASAQGGVAAPASEPAAKLSDEEIDVLVARIALYPDPLLVVVLQASTLPLQVVEANRFLEKRAKDPAARPKDDWDTSITALLNYPSVAKMMSDDLDWTQDLGDAVLTQLVDVQDSVQQLRSELQAVGGLQSDDKQVIKIENAVIRIESAQPNVIFVPTYDPAALLALSSAPPAPAGAPAGTAATSPPTAASKSEPAVAAVAPAASSVAAAPPPPVPAPTESVPAPAAAPAPYPAAAPGYAAPPPAYPYPAPYYPPPAPVAYSDPYPSFWTGAATFAGGAIMGGLIGYAIADDDDCCGDGNWNGGGSVDRNVNRNVNRNTSARDMQAQLQARGGGAQNPGAARGAAATRANTAATRANTAATRTNTAATRANTAIARPPAGAQPRREARGASAPTQRPQRSAAQASPPQASKGALGNVGSAREARNESARGAQSRGAAQNRSTQAMPQRSAGAQPAASRQQQGGAFASRGGGGSGGAFASRGGGGSTARAADRGARSRGGGGGGGRRR